LLGGGGDERRNDAQGGTKFRARSPSSRMRIKLQTRAAGELQISVFWLPPPKSFAPRVRREMGKMWIEFFVRSFFVPAVARLPRN